MENWFLYQGDSVDNVKKRGSCVHWKKKPKPWARIVRKDKALAEAAALLVLQKKFSALGGSRMTTHEERKQVIVY